MGRTTCPPLNAATTNHFSHPHPLKLSNHPPNPSPYCSACKLQASSGPIYSCTLCNYFLHKKCFDMPNGITHPSHKDHAFTLLPRPAYADGFFKCDACGQTGDGFSYHCKPCGIDLHILCAALPLSVSNPCHIHKLDLTFGSPYFNKGFCCDVCKTLGSDHWLYRCNSCGFDAHLNCVTASPVQMQSPLNQFMAPAPPLMQQSFVPQSPVQMQSPLNQFMAPTPPLMQQSFVPQSPANITTNPAVGIPAGISPVMPNPLEINRQQNEMFLQTIQQIINNNHAMTQAMLSGGGGAFGYANQGGVGSGFGNGANGLQQLMQLYSNINANGAATPGLNAFGGANSMGQDYFLQAFMNSASGGGGGGGQEYLQALMNGGGGTEFLQSLLGGGGGFDFLGGALGAFGM